LKISAFSYKTSQTFPGSVRTCGTGSTAQHSTILTTINGLLFITVQTHKLVLLSQLLTATHYNIPASICSI